MKMRNAWLLLAALCAGLALVAAGCGGDDDDAAGTGGAATDGGGAAAAEQVITYNWGAEPPSLDPGLATDTTSANILLSIMDPLVKLDDELQAVEAAAASWEESEDKKSYTITLRDDLKWTNGDPVTAEDYEWSWKRTISPELAADYAYQFFGIAGAEDYNGCDAKKTDCAALADKVGVEAVDDKTLKVTLRSPQPWFIQQLSHHSFLAVHRPTVEQYGEKWTEAANIVTNGAFKLERWEHNSAIDLVKWDEWRDADSVSLTRINGRMITDGVTAVQAFEAGELDATGGLPTQEIARLKETPEYEQYEALGTYYYGFNVKNIPDVKQRRAMSMAINRREIIDNIAQADQLPGTGFTPKGMPGFDEYDPKSPWTPEEGNIEEAKALMAEVANPKKNINLLLNDAPGHRDIAVAVQDAWKELGLTVSIKQQEWAQFLEFLGPPPDKSVDVFRLAWIADYPDAFNFLELWTCDSGNNNSNFCSEEYDGIIDDIRNGEIVDEAERFEAYGRMEDILVGEEGELPFTPIYFYTYTQLEKESIKETMSQDALSQIDFTEVEVRE
jgi:oligopeptide transport system substrate-binding protein